MPIRIKPFILEMTGRYVPDFHEISTKRKGYWFRCDRHPPYYESIVIDSSQKERILGCDVSWSFFPIWDGTYGTHQMSASAGLPCLRLGSKAIPAEESYYEHDGTAVGIQRALDRVGSELVTHALPWFQDRAQEAGRDPLLQHGLDWLRDHEHSIPATIHDGLLKAFAQASHLPWRVEMPIFDALKRELRDFAAKIEASSLARTETKILAQHLLIYAADTKRNTG